MCGKNERNAVFISHCTVDAEVALMIRDYLVHLGIPNENIFCTSIPGNDVKMNFFDEIREWLERSAVIILIFSEDYYKSSYCLNEAGIAWYLYKHGVNVLPVGLPEIKPENMEGFLNKCFILRRMDDAQDVSGLYDGVNIKTGGARESGSRISYEAETLVKKYKSYIKNRKAGESQEDDKEKDATTTVEKPKNNSSISTLDTIHAVRPYLLTYQELRDLKAPEYSYEGRYVCMPGETKEDFSDFILNSEIYYTSLELKNIGKGPALNIRLESAESSKYIIEGFNDREDTKLTYDLGPEDSVIIHISIGISDRARREPEILMNRLTANLIYEDIYENKIQMQMTFNIGKTKGKQTISGYLKPRYEKEELNTL